MLFVIKVKPLALACPAIKTSYGPIGVQDGDITWVEKGDEFGVYHIKIWLT